MIRLQVSAQPPRLNNPDLAERLRGFAGRSSPRGLHAFLERLEHGRREAEGSVNEQLLLEDVWLSWSELAGA